MAPHYHTATFAAEKTQNLITELIASSVPFRAVILDNDLNIYLIRHLVPELFNDSGFLWSKNMEIRTLPKRLRSIFNSLGRHLGIHAEVEMQKKYPNYSSIYHRFLMLILLHHSILLYVYDLALNLDWCGMQQYLPSFVILTSTTRQALQQLNIQNRGNAILDVYGDTNIADNCQESVRALLNGMEYIYAATDNNEPMGPGAYGIQGAAVTKIIYVYATLSLFANVTTNCMMPHERRVLRWCVPLIDLHPLLMRKCKEITRRLEPGSMFIKCSIGQFYARWAELVKAETGRAEEFYVLATMSAGQLHDEHAFGVYPIIEAWESLKDEYNIDPIYLPFYI